jgi:hypothetical protein
VTSSVASSTPPSTSRAANLSTSSRTKPKTFELSVVAETAAGTDAWPRWETDDRLRRLAAREPSTDLVVDYVRYIVERLLGHPELPLALFELRLEAARRPELHEILTRTLRQGFDADVSFHVNAGLPGGAEEVRLLHFAIDGLILDRLTPGVGHPYDVDATVAQLVRRLTREN